MVTLPVACQTTDGHNQGFEWSNDQRKGSTQMLILTRKRDESIRIGEDIVVRVMRTSKGSVKLGIEAPETVRIVRSELNEAVAVHDDHADCDVDALLLQH